MALLSRPKRELATSTTLRTRAAILQAEVDSDNALIRHFEEGVVDAYADSQQQGDALIQRVSQITPGMPARKQAIALILEQAAEAERREKFEAFTAKRAKLDKATTRLAAQIEPRYTKIVSEMVALFHELEANEQAVQALSEEARELGEVGLLPAEYRARSQHYLVTRAGFDSLLRLKLPNFDGSFAWSRSTGSNAL